MWLLLLLDSAMVGWIVGCFRLFSVGVVVRYEDATLPLRVLFVRCLHCFAFLVRTGHVNMITPIFLCALRHFLCVCLLELRKRHAQAE